MANYETKLVVGADTSQAERELEKLKNKADQVKSSADEATQIAPPAAPGQPPPARQRADVPNLGAQGDAFGRTAGRQIGRAIAGFALHQVASIGFAAARTPGGNNVNVDRAEATMSGALQYGTMGAMVAGPWGAVIGGLAGAVAGLAKHETELQKTISENRIARDNSWNRGVVSSTVRASDSAFSELLRGRTLSERADMLEARREELRNGEGAWSIRNLWADLERREAAGDTQSNDYKVRSEYLAMQMQRDAQLTDQIIATKMENTGAYAVRADDYSDAYLKKGLTVGGDAATAALDEQLAIGREQVQLLRRIADMGGGGADRFSTNDIERALTFE